MRQTVFLISFTFLYLLTFSQKQESLPTNSSPLIVGRVVVIKSAILSEERALNIYLPEEYNASDTAHFPVVYLLDGGIDEDFLHISGLYQFNSFPWIKTVSPSIIVGIVNKDRQRDMTFPSKDTGELRRYPNTGHSDKFINFIQKELQPFIQANFRSTPAKTVIGESLGGLLATEILFKKPELFNEYIIVSPSLWWDNGSLLKSSVSALEDSILQETSVYIGVGKEGLTPSRIPRVMEVDANVLADKIQSVMNKKLAVYFDYLPQENHATIMHQAVFNALRLLATNAL